MGLVCVKDVFPIDTVFSVFALVVPCSSLLSRSERQTLAGSHEEIPHEDSTAGSVNSAVGRCPADLALQYRLGILSERRLGFGRTYSGDIGVDGSPLA